jgi:hypothetical protein
MIIGRHRLVGFDTEKLDMLIGIKEVESIEAQTLLAQDLRICPQKNSGYKCD